MSDHSLLPSVVLVCFSFGVLVGRLAEQWRLLKRAPTDWDRLWLLLFTAGLLNVMERAGQAGWFPDSHLFATLVTAGNLVVVLPIIYLVAKIYLEVKRSTVQHTQSSKVSTKP